MTTQSAPATPSAVVSMDLITKTFPGVKALDQVKLDLYPGQVTALVGENGAGKSTTVKILTGIYRTDGGTIRIDGDPVTFGSPNDAAKAGITAIHQETVLFDELSVAENIYIGHAPRNRFGLINSAEMHRNATKLLSEIGAPFSSHTQLRELGIANKHLVAIARALSVDARVVIMDEPTAALSHKEIEELYELVENLKAQGKAILFISHKFDEIFRIADRYTVFRDGGFVGDGLIADITESDLVSMMVGRSVDQRDLLDHDQVSILRHGARREDAKRERVAHRPTLSRARRSRKKVELRKRAPRKTRRPIPALKIWWR